MNVGMNIVGSGVLAPRCGDTNGHTAGSKARARRGGDRGSL